MVQIYNSGPSNITAWRIDALIFGIYANALLLGVAVFFLKQILKAMKETQMAQLQHQKQQAQTQAAQNWNTEQQHVEEKRTQSQHPSPGRAINKPSGLVPLGGWKGGDGGSRRRVTSNERLSDL
jgi:hypothetical protein